MSHEKQGDTRRPGHGFVLMPNCIWQCFEELLFAHKNLMMVGFQMAGDFTSMGKLAVSLFLVTYRKGLDWGPSHLRHERGDSTRVDSTTEEHPQWDVTHK